jgi:gp16 family phage-associated protein
MKPPRIKTPEEVKSEFLRRGESIAAWCKKNKVSTAAAYRVLREPTLRATRGDCHRAAVLLGLKAGEVNPEHATA